MDIGTLGYESSRIRKHCSMGHISRNMEDSSIECDLMSCGGLTQELTEEKNVSMWHTEQSCDILVKKVATF